jgi:phosphoribosylanthranilate isomerase
MRTRIKICCISSGEEAMMAIGAGADALGLVGKMPSGPGPIDDDLIASIAKIIYPPVSSFLLTCEQSATGIIQHIQRTHVSTVQIVDELTEGTYRHIRDALPHLRIVQVIHVNNEKSIIQANNIHEMVDAILLDSGDPEAAVRTLGGTGNTHNWNISRRIVESVSKPVFLAGGLNSENIKDAIAAVQPFGVDVCSGVRTGGRLDPVKLKAFISAVNNV